MPKSDDRPVQHTPVHLRGEVFDERHPAASAFAPLQPAAGVVADDVEERGQNLRGGPTASDANKEHAGQKELLREQHAASLRAAAGLTEPNAAAKVEGDQAKPAKSSGSTKKS